MKVIINLLLLLFFLNKLTFKLIFYYFLGENHMGFSLDTLLKLQSAKAFDKKTSILQYVIILIHRSDETILSFPGEISSITPGMFF
jgi:hypothetical protein